MNIYTADQVRAWDAYSIQHEPIASIDLMERAAQKCTDWLLAQAFENRLYKVFCGKGNNGGDGLAIARMLLNQGIEVQVYILEFGRKGSDDFQTNLHRLHELPVDIHFLQSAEHLPLIQSTDIVIDALFGSGLNKPLQDLSAALVQHINKSKATIIAIDVPSGLFIDQSSKDQEIITATYTLTFQTYKLAFLMAENAAFTGEVEVLDIGLHPEFPATQTPLYQFVDEQMIARIFKPRPRFAHKGNFGHALLIGGSYGKIGAVSLATKACLHTGAGLTTTYLPHCGYTILQTSVPEAMVLTDKEENFLKTLPDNLDKFNVVGVGPGLGTKEATQKFITQLLAAYNRPLVVDADGLNCLALQPEAFATLPPLSILTPHPKEFERLFEDCANDFERLNKAQQKAKAHNIIIVLKGHHTLIALPNGQLFFNTTGNAGMAKGGSGDALTGILTALLAQKYPPQEAALLGVYIHGWAGDLAASTLSEECMTATDLITFLPQVFLKIKGVQK